MSEAFHAGDLISASKLRAMEEQSKLSEVQVGPGIRVSRLAGIGTLVEVEQRTISWSHPWEVRFKGSEKLEVTPGLVNGLMPKIDNVPMDGLDEEGKPHRNGKPLLKFKPKGDVAWVCVCVRTDGTTLTTNGDCLAIDVVEKSTWRDGGSLDEKGGGALHVGHYPLAWMRREKGVWKIYQIAHFCLQWQFSKETETRKARHWFWV